MATEGRLWVVFTLNAVLIGGLVAVGVSGHSLAVLAAGGDYLADAAAIGLSIFTVRLSRRPPTDKRSYGYNRATILAAQVNSSLIVAVTGLVVIESVRRLVVGSAAVSGAPVVMVSAVAAIVMLGCALVLSGGPRHDDLNMRSVLLDTAADGISAGGVALTGVVILVTKRFFWLDSAVALALAVVIGYRAIRLLREVADVLLESTPEGMSTADVEGVILDGGEIEDVHDLHVWSLASDALLLSAHVVLAGHPTLEEAQDVVVRAKARLAEHLSISHATLETECEPCAVPEPQHGRGGG